MKVGLFTALLANLSLDDVIQKIKPLGIRTVELGVGNYPGEPHLKLEWLDQASKLKEFKQKLEDEGIGISALSSHGNPLHPNKQLAQLHAATSKKAIRLAQRLGVKTVIDFSGCPGDSDSSKYPNWSPTAWPPDFQEILKWQWEKKVIPYWTKHAKFAETTGCASASKCTRALWSITRKPCCACARRRDPPSAATSTPATCSGKGLIPAQPCASWVRRYSTFTPRTRACTT